MKRETRFTSKSSAGEIISKIEEAAVPLGFGVKKNNYKVQFTCISFLSMLLGLFILLHVSVSDP